MPYEAALKAKAKAEAKTAAKPELSQDAQKALNAAYAEFLKK